MTISDKAAVERRVTQLKDRLFNLQIDLETAELFSLGNARRIKREIAKVEQQLKELGQ